MGTKGVDGFNLTYDAEWTERLEAREHWQFYWRQASIVEQVTTQADSLIEIGVGSGFLQNYLRSRGWLIRSVDIDEEKNADYTEDASSFDFSSLEPSAVLAFEVFEHLPFPLFLRTVGNIVKAKPRFIIFSVPLSTRSGLQLEFKMPKLRRVKVNLQLPKRTVSTKNHYWELNVFPVTHVGVAEGQAKGLVSRNRLRDVFKQYDYDVQQLGAEGRIQFFMARPAC